MSKRILYSPYLYISILALVWITFFDNYNFFKRYEDSTSLSNLKDERDYYIQQIKDIRMKKKELLTDKETMERFARETYFMKKDSEDVFIFVDEEKGE